jgi:hypothetical protein
MIMILNLIETHEVSVVERIDTTRIVNKTIKLNFKDYVNHI